MTDLTVTQEYFVCAAAKNGKISGTEKALCPVAAGLFELMLEGLVRFENKQFVPLVKVLPPEKATLEPLFRLLLSQKALNVENLRRNTPLQTAISRSWSCPWETRW